LVRFDGALVEAPCLRLSMDGHAGMYVDRTLGLSPGRQRSPDSSYSIPAGGGLAWRGTGEVRVVPERKSLAVSGSCLGQLFSMTLRELRECPTFLFFLEFVWKRRR